MLASISLGAHLIAAILWVGGLAGLARVALGGRAALGSAVPHYSVVALCCALVVGGTGVLNGFTQLEEPAELVSSGYGAVLLAKAAAFGVLVWLGWLHRRRTVPLFSALASAGGTARPGAPRRAFLRLAGVELLVMAGTYGLAVGLSRTPTPAPALPADPVSSAEALLGYPLPQAPTPAALLGTFHPDIFGLAFALLAAGLYFTGVRILRRRGDRWPVSRTVFFAAGAAAVLLVTCTGVGRYAPALFSVHMVQHMTLNMIAPLLLVLGAPITLALRTLPLRERRGLLNAVQSRPARFFAHPVVDTSIFVASLYALYFTPLFEAAMRSHWGHLAMEAHFLASGLLFFWLVVGVDPDPHRPGPLLRIPLLLAVVLTHTIFSVVLVFGNTVIGGAYFAELALPWAPPRLADQALGGGIAWVLGELVIVGLVAALLLAWFAAEERADQARERMQGRVRARAGK